jgi:APA family basic amino acid/polyamine antiporter
MAVIAVVLVDHVIHLVGPMPPFVRSVGACAAIAVFTAANLLGLRTSGRIQVVMAALKLASLALVIGAGLVWGCWALLVARPAAADVPAGGWSSWVLLGLIPILFTFGGAYHATFVAGSVRDPDRSMPRGLFVGVAAVLVAYLGVNVAYLALLGQHGLGASASPAADAISVALGSRAGDVAAAVIVVSAAGILNTVSLGFPFVIYAMAKDGVFFSLAVALQGAFACVAVVVGAARVDVLLTGIAFADATFQGAIAVAHLRGGAQRRRHAPALVTIVFLIIEAGVAVGCLVRTPAQSAYGAIMLAVGVVAWFLWKR